MQLVDERARGVLGAPRAGAPGGGQHDRAAAAAGQAHLGVVPVADARVVGIAFAIDLGGPQEGEVHAAAAAQVVEVFVVEDRCGVLGQNRIREIGRANV